MPRRRGKDHLNHAIATLLLPSKEPFDRHKALFRVVAHLRWPYLWDQQDFAEAVMLAKYLCDKARSGDLESAEIWKHVDLSMVIGELTFTGANAAPYFPIQEDEIDTPRMIADTVRFLLAWRAPTANRRQAASLSKAHKLIAAGYFPHQKISWRHFNEQWTSYKALAALHYVNQFNMNCKFSMVPGATRFTGDVDSLLRNVGTLTKVFGQVKFVQQRLHAILPRHWDDVSDLPVFPSLLEPVEVSAPPLEESMVQHLAKEYKFEA